MKTLDGSLRAVKEPNDGEEKGLVLSGEVAIDVTLRQLSQKKCASCGGPASVSRYDLRRHERTVYCLQCGGVSEARPENGREP